MPVSITREPIDLTALRQRALHPQAGAVLIFCGDIRNHSDNQSVDKLEYESHESMALNQMDQVAEEASQKWPIHYVEIIHRLGIMEVMECSIAIAVSTSHRADAYEASRFIIDTVKRSVPIWKKEFFQMEKLLGAKAVRQEVSKKTGIRWLKISVTEGILAKNPFLKSVNP